MKRLLQTVRKRWRLESHGKELPANQVVFLLGFVAFLPVMAAIAFVSGLVFDTLLSVPKDSVWRMYLLPFCGAFYFTCLFALSRYYK